MRRNLHMLPVPGICVSHFLEHPFGEPNSFYGAPFGWRREAVSFPVFPRTPSVIMVKDKKASEFATRDYTIHLSKRLYGVTFKKRAPRAVREVKKFAQKMMKTR